LLLRRFKTGPLITSSMPSNCWGCNDILSYTKKAKLCQSCRIQDENKKQRPKWITDKDLGKGYGGEFEGGEKKAKKTENLQVVVTCMLCKESFSSEDERGDHCCE